MKQNLLIDPNDLKYVPEPKVEDIAATRLVYYVDSINKDKLIKFLIKHKILTIPDSEDSRFQYEFNPKDKSFKKVIIDKTQKVQSNIYVFDREILNKFLINHTLFVYNNNVLIGALHFTDYNKMPINIYLYAQIIELEHLLRILLNKNHIDIEDFVIFFAEKSKKSKYYKDKLDNLKQVISESFKNNTKLDLSIFYLVDLIDMLNHKKILKISRDIQEIRNAIMHARVNVDTAKGFSTTSFFYDFASFETFFTRVLELEKIKKQVETLIRL